MKFQINSKKALHINNEKGVTIVESIMAVAIFGFGLLSYGVTSGSIMDTNIKSTKKSIATTIAQDQLETFKNMSFLTDGATGDDMVNQYGELGGNYKRTWGIDMTSEPCNCFYDVWVKVEWNNKTTQLVTLKTQISL